MIIWAVSSLITAAVLAGLLTIAVRRIAVARNWVGQEMPHHFHDGPVPRIGGISIFITVLTVATIGIFFPISSVPNLSQFLSIFVAGSVVFVTGLWDDFRPISPLLKATFEILAGVILYLGGIRIESLPPIWLSIPSIFSFVLTIVWVLGITNAFNLIDGLDGLAAGSGLISTLAVAVLFTIAGRPELAIFSLIVAGALAGFLKFNFSPAVVFLGDCGSLLVGFLMSALGLLLLNTVSSHYVVLIPLLAFGLPVLDTALAIVRRVLKKQPIYMPDCEHMHHQLVARGFSVPGAATTLYGVSVFFAVVSVLLVRMPNHYLVLLGLPVGCVAGCFVGFGYHRYIPELQQFSGSEDSRISDSRTSERITDISKGTKPLSLPSKPPAKGADPIRVNEVLAGRARGHGAGIAFSDD